ncbi:MAG: ABC-three component system protein [Planctomycetaceae bacterium]|nr:hypothetical protein [Planctomycetaceae bacterium]
MSFGCKYSAAASAYGYFFQLCRAAERLLTHTDCQAVALETLDDVVEYNYAGIEAEQDKATLVHTNPLVDSGSNLWKTLRIWVELEETHGQALHQYTLVTNSTVRPQASSFIGRLLERDSTVATDLLAYEAADATVQEILPFLSEHRASLEKVLSKLEVSYAIEGDVNSVARSLQCIESIKTQVAESIVGWLFAFCMDHWQRQQSVVVGREVFLTALGKIVYRVRSERWRLRPEVEIILQPADVAGSRSKRFVDHLLSIELTDDMVSDSILDFLRTQSEKTRLLDQAEVLPTDFEQLDKDSRRHWTMKKHEILVEHPDFEAVRQGKLIWTRTMACPQLHLCGVTIGSGYFSSGTLHYLAEQDQVYWHPHFSGDLPVEKV